MIAADASVDGITWNILGQIYLPKQLTEDSFAWHAEFPPDTFVPPHIHPDPGRVRATCSTAS